MSIAAPNQVQCFINDAEWQRMVSRMADLTMRTAHSITMNVAKDYTRAAAKLTRVAKKIGFRKITTARGDTLWLPVSPPVKPRGYGFAKMGWFKSLEGLGVKMRKPNKQKYLGAGIYERKSQSFFDTITVGNAVPYISNLDTSDAIDSQAQKQAWFILEKNVRRYEQQMGALG